MDNCLHSFNCNPEIRKRVALKIFTDHAKGAVARILVE